VAAVGLPCNSHYFITRAEVDWRHNLTAVQAARAREADPARSGQTPRERRRLGRAALAASANTAIARWSTILRRATFILSNGGAGGDALAGGGNGGVGGDGGSDPSGVRPADSIIDGSGGDGGAGGTGGSGGQGGKGGTSGDGTAGKNGTGGSGGTGSTGTSGGGVTAGGGGAP